MERDLAAYKEAPTASTRQRTYTYTEGGARETKQQRLIALDLDEIVALTITEEQRSSLD